MALSVDERLIELTINGEAKRLDHSTTVARLLEHLELNPRQVAVEVNLDLVPRGQHADHQLRDGDCVEVVTLVGGG